MTWQKFDWLFHEATLFREDLQGAARIHSAAYETLTRAHDDHLKQLESDRSTFAGDPQDLAQYKDWLEYERAEQTDALAAMYLSLVASMLEGFLDRAKKPLDRVHPASSNYQGASKLAKRISEYRQRFGIELESLPQFATVREIILARNACVHNDSAPTEDYNAQTRRRYVDQRGKINLTPDQIEQSAAELAEFAEALTDQLCRVRDEAKPPLRPAIRRVDP